MEVSRSQVDRATTPFCCPKCKPTQRSIWRHNLYIVRCDQFCVTTEIKQFDKVDNCLIFVIGLPIYQNFIANIIFIKYCCNYLFNN